MKKVLTALVLFGMLLIQGCEPGYTRKNFPVLPDELKDCNFYVVDSGNGNDVLIARCPNSSTTTKYMVGKTPVNSIVIEGE